MKVARVATAAGSLYGAGWLLAAAQNMIEEKTGHEPRTSHRPPNVR
jgi:hypothetical protein